MRIKKMIKAVAFVSLFLFLFCSVSKIMTSPADYRNYQWIAGFYEEEENSLDAVYFGSSNCYTFWNAPIAWEEYGIAVYPYACNSQPFITTEYLMREARKTQKEALYIVNVNAVSEDLNEAKLHYLLDYMPFSLNKLRLTSYLAKTGGYTLKESMEFYFPLLRYHTRWSELQQEDFNYEINGLKGAAYHGTYVGQSADVRKHYVLSDEMDEQLSEVMESALDSLLDYCDEENLNVLFVTVPRAEVEVEDVTKINKINHVISSRGYPVLNLLDKTQEIGLDLTKDYYHVTHTNIHGSIKFTYYLSEYLIENYGFKDKRGSEAYSSWDEAFSEYSHIMAPYMLDIELDSKNVDYSLKAPDDLTAESDGEKITVSYSLHEGADGYAVYRKDSKKSPWKQLAVLKGTVYEDDAVESDKDYYYTVVPFYEKDGEKIFGSFNYFGISESL